MNDVTSLMDEMDGATDKESCVKVEGFAYPGTKITINETSTTLTKSAQHSRFVKDGADVRIKGF